jgi:predicted N-formylglutamate amidohydrolase
MAADHAVVDVFNRTGQGPFVIVCEHASNEMPPEFRRLGLDPKLLKAHIAWDPGARGVAEQLARLLDAPMIMPRVSRLIHDCNRPQGSEDAIPVKSEIFEIPGNRNLTPEQRQERGRRFYAPFHDALRQTILDKSRSGLSPILVTIHSFTPVFKGKERTVELGILHDEDRRLADSILTIAEKKAEVVVGRNRPYGPADGVTHTLRVHALPLGLLNVMIEIKNDLIRDKTAQARMAKRLSRYLDEALTLTAPENRVAGHA